jgi:monoamine oxidase
LPAVPQQLETDVCVVGAGYAGLTAARRLAQSGRNVVVLEARERVGGRIWTEAREGGWSVDRGGAWLAPYHDAAFALASDVGVSTYKTWVKGAHLLIGDGRIRRYTGLIPKISPRAVLAIALNQARIDRLARRVPLEAPWTARRAEAWDARSVQSFLQSTRIPSGIARDLFDMAVRGLFATDLNEVSFLNLLMLVHGHHSIAKLFGIEGGAQENLVDGGAGAMAARMASDLGDAVHLNSAVRAIRQHADHVVVEAGAAGAGLTVTAPFVVVATPPALNLEIEFDPPLADDRRTLYEKAVAGIETKTLVVYDTPFWRDAGFSGQSADPGSAAEVTIDSSPVSGTPGVIASFTFGAVAERIDTMEPGERRRAVLDSLASRFGARAATPIDYVETAWWTEPWTRGCSMAHLPPGILTRYGHLIRQPFQRVHWAGTETSTVSHGAIDGAIRSGQRAATEILSRD